MEIVVGQQVDIEELQHINQIQRDRSLLTNIHSQMPLTLFMAESTKLVVMNETKDSSESIV